MSDENSEITKDVYLVVPAFNEEKTVSQMHSMKRKQFLKSLRE